VQLRIRICLPTGVSERKESETGTEEKPVVRKEETVMRKEAAMGKEAPAEACSNKTAVKVAAESAAETAETTTHSTAAHSSTPLGGGGQRQQATKKELRDAAQDSCS
jgi:hypothetical protein